MTHVFHRSLSGTVPTVSHGESIYVYDTAGRKNHDGCGAAAVSCLGLSDRRVVKTWVREIHVFDDEPFIQHNVFRSPGSFFREELEGGSIKSTFHADRYASMRKGIVAHTTCIDDTNVEQPGDFDTVFLCVDSHPIKARILEVCLVNDTLLIDVGMGLHRAGDALAGTLRTIAFHSGYVDHAEHCMDLAGDDA